MKHLSSRSLIVLLLFSLLQFSPCAHACTTFCLKDGKRLVFGRNYDWGIGYGHVMVNKRNLSKRAFNFRDPTSKPAQWVAKFGSITFNQYGKEFPMGGMNETGLVVEVMKLNETRFPDAGPRPALGELQWVQYQLDNFSRVKQVIESDSSIRITASSQPIHFLVCDRTGDTATIEFLEGKLVCHTKDTLPVEVLTNNTFEDSMHYLKAHKNLGGARPMPASEGSLDRFTRAADMVQEYEQNRKQNIVDYAFSILDNVKQVRTTQWSIVYDQENRAVHFKTKDAPKKRSFRLENFHFSHATPSRVINMHTDQSGDLRQHFVEYTSSINRKLIGLSFSGTEFLQNIPDEALDQLAKYPQSIMRRGD